MYVVGRGWLGWTLNKTSDQAFVTCDSSHVYTNRYFFYLLVLFLMLLLLLLLSLLMEQHSTNSGINIILKHRF